MHFDLRTPTQYALRAVRFKIGQFPEPGMEIIRHAIDTTKLAIDVGAHTGGYIHAVAAMGCKSIVAFEANPQKVKVLRRFYGNTAKIVHAAVSSEPGHASLRVPYERTKLMDGLATIEPSNQLGDAAVTEMDVEKVTLDEAIHDPVGFIKVDVEGHELDVLRGAMRILTEDHPVILIEAEERHRRNAVNSIREFLKRYGYIGLMLDRGRMVSIDFFDVARDQAAPNDLAALNSGHYKGHYINNFLFLPSVLSSSPAPANPSSISSVMSSRASVPGSPATGARGCR